ncbi:MAG: 4Fe-4S dicluster domain-containing protein [Solirubrobacteraceae bacterium]
MSDALFIDVVLDASIAADRELALKLAEVCPVDIFRAGAGGIEIVRENLDECVLCQLCMNAAPPGAVRVIKLYDGGAVLGAPEQ